MLFAHHELAELAALGVPLAAVATWGAAFVREKTRRMRKRVSGERAKPAVGGQRTPT